MPSAYHPMRRTISLVIISAVLWLPVSASAQDLVPISSLTGGSSVFVYRNAARAVRRPSAESKPNRTKQQRLETVAKLNKQYTATAKLHREVSKEVDPSHAKDVKTLSPTQGAKVLAGIGEYYLSKNDVEKAMEFFRDAVGVDAKNKAANAGLSDALAINGNQLLAADQAASAKGYFLESLKYNPGNAGALFGLGEVYSELDQTAAAIDAYEKSIAANKDLTSIYVPLGILYYQNGDIAKADAMLAKALASPGGDSPETQFFLGLVRLAQARDNEALAGFLKSDPTQAETFYYTGQAQVRLKRTADAAPNFRKAAELKPNYFEAWFSLGEAEYELGHWDAAAAAYKAALKIKNTDWASFAGVADSLRQSGHYEEAAGYYSNAASFYTKEPDHKNETLADLYSKRGLSLGQQCELNMQRSVICAWPATIKALQQAYDLSKSPVDQVNLGWAYFRAGHFDAELRNMPAAKPNLEAARAVLVTAAAAGGQISDFANQNLAAVLIDLGDFKGAIETLGKLVKSKPDLVFAKYALGVAYFKSGDAVNAEKALRDAVQADPKNVAYLVGLGDVLINRRNGKDARKIADQLRTLDTASAEQLDKKIKLSRL